MGREHKIMGTVSAPVFLCILLVIIWNVPASQPLVRTVNRRVPPEEFAETWGVNPDRMRESFGRNEKVRLILKNCSAPANVLWPGETASFTFHAENLTDKALDLSGKVHIIRYQTYTKPGTNFFKIGIRKLKETGTVPIAIKIEPEGWGDVTVTPKIPERFGGYALIVDFPGQDRLFGASCVRSYKPEHHKKRFYKLTVDLRDIDALKRLGVAPNRIGMSYMPTTRDNFEKRYEQKTEYLRRLQEAGRTVTVEFGAGARDHQPLGRPRPWLDENDVMKKGKSDMAWLPSMDDDFRRFVKKLLVDYGWPRGPINGVMLWNEPWEGISISGWGADMIRYRNLYTAMAQGVEDAEQEAGVEVFIGGCDSSSNTMDKLFGDGSKKFLKWLDFMSIHYQGTNPCTTIRMFNERTDENGNPAPVQVWDTESWVANSDDRIAGVLAAMYSFGQKRVVGINSNKMVTTSFNTRLRGFKGKRRILQTWSAGAAIGAFQHFVGERDFRELLFRKAPPFVMIFEGENQEDGTVVVLGDLGSVFGFKNVPFFTCRSQQEVRIKEELRKKLASLPANAPEREEITARLKKYMPWTGAKMTLRCPDNAFSLYDFYGNRVETKNGEIVVPLDARGFYLRGNGEEGSFSKLLAALKNARVYGVEPLVTEALDMTAPIAEKPAIRLKSTNTLNRPIKGELNVSVAGLKVRHPQTVSFRPHERKIINVRITDGEPRADNLYPMRMVFDAGDDGLAVHEETMRVNWIENRNITVDGQLDDWEGAIPQQIRAEGMHGATMMEKVWRPFLQFDESVSKGFAVGYLAYDEKYFYFGTKISDSSPHPGTVRFETRNDDDYFYPEVCYQVNADKTFATVNGGVKGSFSDLLPVKKPGSKEKISARGWKGLSRYAAFDIDAGESPTAFSVYYLHWKGKYPRWSRPEILARDSGEKLLKVKPEKTGYGTYFRFLIRGKVRLHFPSNWRRGAIVGLFLDPAKGVDGEGLKNPGAKFLGTDTETEANWPGAYGKRAFLLPGGSRGGEHQRIRLVNDVKKKKLEWPEGVRRYSYRKLPMLPAGNAPRFDNIQIAFNVLPPEKKWMKPYPPGTMPHYIGYADTDYEYALNKVADE
ncbi:MAG: hypothetical protein KGZ25_08170, partial [Planctomycetes bacterium]|nr:hypothetical protein [Planctomycetota bacterium]